MTFIGLAVVLLIGQGLLAIALIWAVHTLGVYTERLEKTHQRTVLIRLNFAKMQNDIAAQAALRKYQLPKKE